MNINQRLDKVKKLIENDDFLAGTGLSNEENIRIFCYEAKDEMIVKHFIKQLTECQDLCGNIVECNLYNIMIEICEREGITDDIAELEEREGSDFLLKQLQSMIKAKDYLENIKANSRDVLLITGVGDVFPFIRVHTFLESLQPILSNPVLVMYPGRFENYQLKLFDKLSPNNYYRAFEVIE